MRIFNFFGFYTRPVPPQASRAIHFAAPHDINGGAQSMAELRRFAIAETITGSNRWNIVIEVYERGTLDLGANPDIYEWKFDGFYAQNLAPFEVRQKMEPHLKSATDRKRLGEFMPSSAQDTFKIC